MASVDFEKYKMSQIRAILRHCDKDLREMNEHSNRQIDKQLTCTNIQYDKSYEQTCDELFNRIAYLDSLNGANKRKDRVICLGLNVPLPKRFDTTKDLEWFDKVEHIIKDQFGERNVLQRYIHRDEVHQYRHAETRQLETSRIHAHFFVIPELDKKLVAKHVCCRANFIKLNNSIQEMTVSDYRLDFMDGTKKKSKATVEELKNKSADIEYRMIVREEVISDVREELRKELEHEYAEKLKEAESILIQAGKERDRIIESAKEEAKHIIEQAKEKLKD
ncbi:plasmid recombination protein [bacterium]|nr:plasmid recombination protein [bacterium]